MSPYGLEHLLIPWAMLVLVGGLVAFLVTRWPLWSLAAALVKSLLFFIYFSLFFDGTFTFFDDWEYLQLGLALHDEGVNLFNALSHLPQLFIAGNGLHFLYYLLNAEAIRLFGYAYSSPVAFNVLLTFLAAAFMSRVARDGLGLSPGASKGAFLFLVLHPDIVAWSTVINGKDILVLAGTAAFIFAVSKGFQGQRRSAFIVGSAACFVLFFTRFYIPLMLLSALVATVWVSKRGRNDRWIGVLALAGAGAVVVAVGTSELSFVLDMVKQNLVNPIYGFVRFALTPIPFNATEEYAFLNAPQLFHWAMLPLLVLGAFRIWTLGSVTARFIIVYFMSIMVVYALFGELQGPRHRVQIDGLIALFQFVGALQLLNEIKRSYNAIEQVDQRNRDLAGNQ